METRFLSPFHCNWACDPDSPEDTTANLFVVECLFILVEVSQIDRVGHTKHGLDQVC